MAWYERIGIWLKNIFTLISRVMKLEDRVSALEKKMETAQAPVKDIKESLEYNKDWNYYQSMATGERFCPICVGNGKKITISWNKNSMGEGWHCQNCKANEWKDSPGDSLPSYGIAN